MRFKSPLIAVSAVGMLALSACGGSGSSSNPTANGGSSGSTDFGATGTGKDANAKGPVTISGAQKGGTVTVLTLTGPHHDHRPERDLLHRHLVDHERPGDALAHPVQVRPDEQADGPGPRPGHRPRHSQRQLHQVEVHDPSRREVGERPRRSRPRRSPGACRGAWTPPRSRPAPASTTRTSTSRAERPTRAPTPPSRSRAPWPRRSRSSGNTITITMAKPFPDMPYWGTFPANGPIPLSGKASDPKTYKNHPLSTGPYKIASTAPSKELQLVRNTQLGPEHRPGSHAVPRRLRLQDPAAVGEDRPDPARRHRLRPDHADLRRPAGA